MNSNHVLFTLAGNHWHVALGFLPSIKPKHSRTSPQQTCDILAPGMGYPGPRLNRINRVFIPTRCIFFFGSLSQKNLQVKCAWLRAILDEWPTEKFSRVRTSESRLEGGVNRAKLKFTKLITSTSRVSVRNIIESASEGEKQIASK